MKAKSFYAGVGVWPGGREANYEQSGLIAGTNRTELFTPVVQTGTYPSLADHKAIVKKLILRYFNVVWGLKFSENVCRR